MKNKADQSGMTLVEIMIALLIGVFLLGGILQIFVSGKQTNRMQENLSRLQENGRFAMDFLSKDIRMAGYRACLPFAVPTPIAGTNDNGLNSSDIITIQRSNSACAVPPSSTVFLTTAFFLQVGASGQPGLFKRDDADPAIELIEGIENMQILYGVRNSAASPVTFYYVAAGTAGLDMTKVISIRITLTARTLEGNLTTTGDGRIRRNFTSTIVVRNQLE